MRTIFAFITCIALSITLAAPLAARDDLQFADGLYSEGMFDLAAKEYRKLLESARGPRASAIRLRLGDAYLQLEQYADAATALRPIVERDPSFEQYVEAAYRLGRALIESGEVGEAVRVLRRAEKQIGQDRWDDTLSQHVHYWLAEAFYRNDQHDKALAALEKVLEHRVDTDIETNARYTAAWAAYRVGDPERSIVHMDRFLATKPDPDTVAECRYVRGECLFQLERYEDAAKEYTAAAKRDTPHRADAELAIAWCDFEREDFKRAARGFARFAESRPDHVSSGQALLQAGISAFRAGRADDARAWLTSARARSEVSSEAAYWLGMTEKNEQNWQAAFQALQGIKTDDSDLAERTQLATGECLYRLERYDEAVEAFSRIGDGATPESKAYALHASSLCRQAQGRSEDALQLAHAHREAYPESEHRSASLMVEGESLFELERYEPAAIRFAELLRSFPDDAAGDAATYKLGWCLTELGRHEDARQAFLTVTNRYPKSPLAVESRKLAAQSLAELGKSEEAIRELEAVAGRSGSVGEQARLDAARLQSERGDFAAAVDSYEEIATSTSDRERRARARYEQAELLYRVRDIERSAAAYRDAIESSEDPAIRRAARYGLAWALYDLDRPSEAGQEAQALLAEGGLDTELEASTMHLVGASAQRLGDAARACEAFEMLLANHPKSSLAYEARFGLGVCQAAMGRHDEAAKTLDTVLRRHRDGSANDRVLYELAFVHEDAGRADERTKAFRQLVREYPSSPLAPEVRFRLGEERYEADDLKGASEAYAAVLTENPGEYLDEALYKKGWADKKRGESAEAVVCFKRLAEECPKSPLRGEALYLAAELSRELGDPKAAEAHCRILLTTYPEHELTENTHLTLGLALHDSEAWDAALRELQDHRTRYPESERLFEVDFSIGRCLQQLGRIPSAVQAFRRVTSAHRGETAARAQYEIGECFRAQSNFEDALSEYLKVRFLYAHDDWIAASLYRSGQCFEKLGQDDRARSTYTELASQYPKSEWAKRIDKNGSRTGL